MESKEVKFSMGEVVVPNDNINAAFRYTGKSCLVEGVEYRHPTEHELSYFLMNVENEQLVEYKDEKQLSKMYQDSIKSSRKSRNDELGKYRSMERSAEIWKSNF